MERTATIALIIALLTGCSVPQTASGGDSSNPGSEDRPAKAATATPCNKAREAILTGSDEEIRAALEELVKESAPIEPDKASHTKARESAKAYLDLPAGAAEVDLKYALTLVADWCSLAAIPDAE